jgi:hypothetical protein
MARTPEQHFVIGVYGYKNCSPVHLDGYTLEAAKRAKNWQGVGGGNSTTFHICTPHPTERGTFVSVDTGALFAANPSGWTKEAWADFLARTWPGGEG